MSNRRRQEGALNGARRQWRQGPQRVELWCRGCGYGIVVTDPPPCCPICGGQAWTEPPVTKRGLAAL